MRVVPSPNLGVGRGGPGHLPHQMHHRIAMGDVSVELRQRVVPEPLEIFLHLYRDILPRQIAAQLFPVKKEFIGDGG